MATLSQRQQLGKTVHVAPNQRVIIVGDIHGCLVEFKELLQKVDYRKEYDKLILVGDLVGKVNYLYDINFYRNIITSNAFKAEINAIICYVLCMLSK